ncbi:hypothetical protein [Streptomyces sp. NPDC001422]|uniref:hypothetical protein n=1 Tax=Streptomyces sp. NPDC001422 TaxID=3364575 RepID=UPI00367B2027
MTGQPLPALRYIGDRRMQCKDIPDDVLIGAIRRTKPVTSGGWRMLGHVSDELAATIGWVPRNLLLAKLRKVCDKGQVGGCPCGCRGDFHLPDECADPGCCPQNSTRGQHDGA